MSESLPPASEAITISIVMPVFDSLHYLESSLPPLAAIEDPRLLEILVVDDGSTDRSAEYARSCGARVLQSGGRLGPGAARNVGVREARGEIVLFIDADVVLGVDSFARIAEKFSEPITVAVFGSYDSRPAYPGFMSQYMNLRHHHGHQIPSDDASTFWAGLGAVRRGAFLAIGGFDGERFRVPSIEDIELGHRLRSAGGRIRRDPRIEANHLKQWSLLEVVRTDVFRRALPLARLKLENSAAFNDLNLRTTERWKATLAGVLAVSTLLALVGYCSLWVPIALFALAALVNRELVALFARNGWWFALRGLLFHQIYYLYSGATFAYCAVLHSLRLTRAT